MPRLIPVRLTTSELTWERNDIVALLINRTEAEQLVGSLSAQLKKQDGGPIYIACKADISDERITEVKGEK